MASNTQSGNKPQNSNISQHTIDIITNHITTNEEPTRYPYADLKGKITIGTGFLVDDIDVFANLPLDYVDPVTGNTRPATDAEKRQAFNDIRTRNKQIGNNSHALRYANATNIRMPDTEIAKRMDVEVRTRYSTAESLVGSTAWAKLTDQQKAVLVDVEFATGNLKGFTDLIKAAQAGDADAMARESLFYTDSQTKSRDWNRIYRNYQAGSGKGDIETANDLSEIFRQKGETVPKNSEIYRHNWVLPDGKPTPPPRPGSAQPGNTPSGPPAPAQGSQNTPNPHAALDGAQAAPAEALDAASAGDIAGIRTALLQPMTPLDRTLLKQPAQWTEAEMRRVAGSDAYWQAGHTDHRRVQDLVAEWHRHFYSRKPVELDATGRAIPPKPAIALPEFEAPTVDATGLEIDTVLERIAATVGGMARRLGTSGAVSALQEGLNLAASESENRNKGRVTSPALKVDGILGPKTRQAVQRRVASAGHDGVQGALALGALSQSLAKPETARDPDRLTAALADSVTPLFADAGDRQAASRSTALIHETLQETANTLTPNPEKLRLDGDIGPMTTARIGSALSQAGPEKFTSRFGQSLGLL